MSGGRLCKFMPQQTPEEQKIANYAEQEGRHRFRSGQPKSSCPWSDDTRKFYFGLGWEAEKRKRSRIRNRRALGVG